MKQLKTILCLLLLLGSHFAPAAETVKEIKDLSINGGVQDGKARLVIETTLAGLQEDKNKVIYATALDEIINITREKATYTANAAFDILQGEAKELILTLAGEGEIKKVAGENLQDWSVRQETNDTRSLVLRPRKADKPITQLTAAITAEREYKFIPIPFQPLTFASPPPSLFH